MLRTCKRVWDSARLWVLARAWQAVCCILGRVDFAQLSAVQIAFFVILVAAFALLITERLRNDVVAVLIVLSLAVTGILEPAEALAGFSSEPAIVVAAIFVMS